eukprot:gene3803-4198_t
MPGRLEWLDARNACPDEFRLGMDIRVPPASRLVTLENLEEELHAAIKFKVHNDENLLWMEEKLSGCLVPALQELIKAVWQKQLELERPELYQTPDLN